MEITEMELFLYFAPVQMNRVWTFLWCSCFDTHLLIVLNESRKKLKRLYIKVWRSSSYLWLYINRHLVSHVSILLLFAIFPILFDCNLLYLSEESGSCIFPFYKFTTNKYINGPGEMTEHLRILSFLAKDPGSAPSIHMTEHNYL